MVAIIIDIHTHLVNFDRDFDQRLRNDLTRCRISHDTWRFTEGDYLKGTSAADKVIVFGIRAQKTGWDVKNNEVSAFTEKYKEKYIFFASIDPCESGFFDELRYCHHTLGCKGIKLGPVYQGIHPHDHRYYRIYDYCEQNNLPIITHMATTFSSGVPLEYARPIHMDKVSCDFPDLKIVLAHLGHPWEAETLAVIRKQANVYADISALYYRPWQFYTAMRLAVEYGCCDKILFGSDFPSTTTENSIRGFRNMNKIIEGTRLPVIPDEVINQIIYKNSLEALGIQC